MSDHLEEHPKTAVEDTIAFLVYRPTWVSKSFGAQALLLQDSDLAAKIRQSTDGPVAAARLIHGLLGSVPKSDEVWIQAGLPTYMQNRNISSMAIHTLFAVAGSDPRLAASLTEMLSSSPPSNGLLDNDTWRSAVLRVWNTSGYSPQAVATLAEFLWSDLTTDEFTLAVGTRYASLRSNEGEGGDSLLMFDETLEQMSIRGIHAQVVERARDKLQDEIALRAAAQRAAETKRLNVELRQTAFQRGTAAAEARSTNSIDEVRAAARDVEQLQDGSNFLILVRGFNEIALGYQDELAQAADRALDEVLGSLLISAASRRDDHSIGHP